MNGSVAEDDLVLFAVPKKGRIYQDTLNLLKGAGLDARRPDRLDVARCKELPVKLVFLPAADIPSYVLEGNVDLGISGSDMLEETIVGEGENKYPVKVLEKLGYGKCKLCVQAPKVLKVTDAKDFVGKRIVTSFPNLSQRFFDDLDANSRGSTHIKTVSGSVEAACGLGLADAIVDLVETGTTMEAAGLEIVAEVCQSEALLFHTEHKEKTTEAKKELIRTIVKRIQGYLTSTRFLMVVYNCHEDDLSACCQVTPGKRSPTITALKEEGWHSVSSLVPKEDINRVMDELTKLGAKDVLCTSLANTRM